MKWVTRERARVDRIACPWLISRFIDPKPEFLFVPAKQVLETAKREGAIAYDIPDVELGHHGAACSFDAFVERYELDDPALAVLARIVRGADTEDRGLTPESAGLYAAATGFQANSRDDFDNMARQFPMYDALYTYCATTAAKRRPRVVFVCLHGAAKSVVGAAHFRRLAATPARPRPITLYDLDTATRVVSFGCDVSPKQGKVEQWDVPNVGDGYEPARDRIVANVERLVAELSSGR